MASRLQYPQETMETKFHAKSTTIVDRSGTRTVISGDVLEGEIRAGMYVSILLNRALSMTVEIESIEYTVNAEPDKGSVALVLKPEDNAEAEADFIDMLDIQDEILAISESV